MKTSLKKSAFLTALPYIIIAVFFLTAPVFFKTRSWLNSFIMIFVSLVGATSLRTISLSGNMSFAHGAFIGVGAYFAGVLAKSFGVTLWLSIPAGAFAALLLALITGWPFSRLRSIYFVMGSMFMGVAIVQLISALKITGGANGLTGIPSLSKSLGALFEGEGWQNLFDKLGIGNVQLSYYAFFLVMLISLVCLYRFEHSRIGWTLKALSQSPDVAASIGINERFYRLLSVGVGCFFAGLIGAMYAHYNTALATSSYGMGLTLWLIMYVMIGGKNNFLGPIIGAILLELIKQFTTLLTAVSGNSNASESFVAFSRWVGKYSAYSPFLMAAVLLAVAYFLPGGLVSIPSVIKKSIKPKKDSRVLVKAEGGEGDAT